MKKKVVVAMSGGVDSSVAAYLLKEQGYEVLGVTMQVWQNKQNGQDSKCCGQSAVDDARYVANQLNIPYYVLNFKDVFQEKVIDYFIEEYTKGRTPNPCIACNRCIKWEVLLQKALTLGADFMATGHYAKITSHPQTKRLTLMHSASLAKDQSYALYGLTQFHLEHTLMPMGNYTKDDIRALAQKAGLKVATKPDSQEICFIPDDDYGKFIEAHTNTTPGNFVDTDGNIIGRHKGVIYYTIGQRKGLGAFGKKVFVKKIDMAKNEVTLTEDAELYGSEVYADNVNFMGLDTLHAPTKATAKIRYNHQPAPCIAQLKGDLLHIKFHTPQRAITPGQAVVVYDNEMILCGGTII